ncbi:MAG: AraC family transcriptional regulator [Butyrivibrio sp.]|nr:AraC family transcriptional regulator [Butyrivibrio sp.]
MQGKIEGIQESIDFIEKNLTRELDIEDIASVAVLSPSYYQRIFGALCGMTVGEYIRARRIACITVPLQGLRSRARPMRIPRKSRLRSWNFRRLRFRTGL